MSNGLAGQWVGLTVWSSSPEIKLVVDMKKKPHLGHSKSVELGRNARRKNAMIAGIMQTIMMMKRRFGRLSMRNPRAAISELAEINQGLKVDLQINKMKPNPLRGTVPLRRVSRGVKPKDVYTRLPNV